MAAVLLRFILGKFLTIGIFNFDLSDASFNVIIFQPGRLKKVQAIGWYVEDYNIAQVSTNISDYNVSPMNIVYEEVKQDAKV